MQLLCALNASVLEKSFFRLAPISGRFPHSVEELQSTLHELVAKALRSLDLPEDKQVDLKLLSTVVSQDTSAHELEEALGKLGALPEESILKGLAKTPSFLHLTSKSNKDIVQTSRAGNNKSQIMAAATAVDDIVNSQRLNAEAAAATSAKLSACVAYVNELGPGLGMHKGERTMMPSTIVSICGTVWRARGLRQLCLDNSCPNACVGADRSIAE